MTPIVFALCATAPIPPVPNLGVSQTKILRMGRRAWDDYYDSHGGWWKQADESYFDAAQARNDRVLRDPHLVDRGQKRKLAGLVLEFVDTCCSVGQSADDNTGWGPTWWKLRAIEEDTIYAYLVHSKRHSAKPMVVSDVTKLIRKAKTYLKNSTEDTRVGADPSFGKKVSSLEPTFLEIAKLLHQTTDRTGSDRILALCALAAREIDDNTAPDLDRHP